MLFHLERQACGQNGGVRRFADRSFSDVLMEVTVTFVGRQVVAVVCDILDHAAAAAARQILALRTFGILCQEIGHVCLHHVMIIAIQRQLAERKSV